MAWKPIADAPKDGTKLLLGTTYPTARYRVILGKWNERLREWQSEPGSWPMKPTHWMHPPTPPNGE